MIAEYNEERIQNIAKIGFHLIVGKFDSGKSSQLLIPFQGAKILRASFYALIPFHLLNIRPLSDHDDEYNDDILDFE